jgi:hypothetical protein
MLKVFKRSSMLLGVFLAFGVSYGMGETTPMQSVPTGITCKVIDNTGKSIFYKIATAMAGHI